MLNKLKELYIQLEAVDMVIQAALYHHTVESVTGALKKRSDIVGLIKDYTFALDEDCSQNARDEIRFLSQKAITRGKDMRMTLETLQNEVKGDLMKCGARGHASVYQKASSRSERIKI